MDNKNIVVCCCPNCGQPVARVLPGSMVIVRCGKCKLDVSCFVNADSSVSIKNATYRGVKMVNLP